MGGVIIRYVLIAGCLQHGISVMYIAHYNLLVMTSTSSLDLSPPKNTATLAKSNFPLCSSLGSIATLIITPKILRKKRGQCNEGGLYFNPMRKSEQYMPFVIRSMHK